MPTPVARLAAGMGSLTAPSDANRGDCGAEFVTARKATLTNYKTPAVQGTQQELSVPAMQLLQDRSDQAVRFDLPTNSETS